MLMSKTNKGFTLIELMVTVGIGAILLGFAIPNFTETIKNNRIIIEANEIVAGMNYARQAAIAEGNAAAMCHSANPNAAAPVCGGNGSSWNKGFIIYAKQKYAITPSTKAGLTFAPAADRVLKQVILKESNNFTFTHTTQNPANFAGLISFNSVGISSPEGVSHTISICDDRTGLHGSRISVSVSGKIIQEKLTCPVTQ